MITLEAIMWRTFLEKTQIFVDMIVTDFNLATSSVQLDVRMLNDSVKNTLSYQLIF